MRGHFGSDCPSSIRTTPNRAGRAPPRLERCPFEACEGPPRFWRALVRFLVEGLLDQETLVREGPQSEKSSLKSRLVQPSHLYKNPLPAASFADCVFNLNSLFNSCNSVHCYNIN